MVTVSKLASRLLEVAEKDLAVFPSVSEVAAQLREINRLVDGECDVRLQVYTNGDWAVRYGDSSYDQDHRGFWGASCVPGMVDGKAQPFDPEIVARDLLDQVMNDEYGNRRL